MKHIFLAGEGRNELGSWSKDPPYQDDSEPGVLKSLLQKITKDGWLIRNAVRWKNIRKFKAGDHLSPEERNVLGACLMARENDCPIFAFSRDTDGDTQRQKDISKGLQTSQKYWGSQIDIIGECAVPCIEGWILAVLGVLHTEKITSSSKALDSLKNKIGNEVSTERMVEIIVQTNPANRAQDAISLQNWLKTAKNVL
jgi:hypothetical protein